MEACGQKWASALLSAVDSRKEGQWPSCPEAPKWALERRDIYLCLVSGNSLNEWELISYLIIKLVGSFEVLSS